MFARCLHIWGYGSLLWDTILEHGCGNFRIPAIGRCRVREGSCSLGVCEISQLGSSRNVISWFWYHPPIKAPSLSFTHPRGLQIAGNSSLLKLIILNQRPLSWLYPYGLFVLKLLKYSPIFFPPVTLRLRTHAQWPCCAFELVCQKTQRGSQTLTASQQMRHMAEISQNNNVRYVGRLYPGNIPATSMVNPSSSPWNIQAWC